MAVLTALAPSRESGAHPLFGDGPPPGYSGGFAEQNCRACHWENPLNHGDASVELTGLPEHYTPGTTYRIQVTLRHPEMKIAGFQLTARHLSGVAIGKQAGTLKSADERASVVINDTTGVHYAGHTRAGTALSVAGAAVWELHWTAPTVRAATATALTAPAPTASAVIFHVAANAADDTNSEGGDFIYVTERRLPPASQPGLQTSKLIEARSGHD